MRRQIRLWIPVLLIALATACASAAGGEAEGVITLEALKTKMDAKADFVLVDVRTDAEWKAGHLPGAIHIPLNDIPAKASSLPKNKEIVLYCRTGRRSAQAYSYLASQGFTNLKNYKGSWTEWSAKNMPSVKD